MLPKNRRIPTSLLLPALKKSTSFSSEHLTLRVHRLPADKKDDLARVAIIIPAKVIKKSVDRHQSKCQISAWLEKDLNIIKTGQYLIWQVKKDITGLAPTSLSQEIKKLLKLT